MKNDPSTNNEDYYFDETRVQCWKDNSFSIQWNTKDIWAADDNNCGMGDLGRPYSCTDDCQCDGNRICISRQGNPGEMLADGFPAAIVFPDVKFCSGHARAEMGKTHYPYDN